MDKKVYIVNYKETTVGLDSVMEVESGTFDYAYDTEEEAIAVVADCAAKKVEELDDDEEVGEDWSESRDCCCITCGGDTYEYYVYMVTIAA